MKKIRLFVHGLGAGIGLAAVTLALLSQPDLNPTRLSHVDLGSLTISSPGYIFREKCKKIKPGFFSCTSPETEEKAKRIKSWRYDIRTIQATVTAYSMEQFPGRTASGVYGVVGTTIACPRRIPFGSHVSSPVFGLRTCLDRLAAKFDQRFDVFVYSTSDALAFGKRRLELTITR